VGAGASCGVIVSQRFASGRAGAEQEAAIKRSGRAKPLLRNGQGARNDSPFRDSVRRYDPSIDGRRSRRAPDCNMSLWLAAHTRSLCRGLRRPGAIASSTCSCRTAAVRPRIVTISRRCSRFWRESSTHLPWPDADRPRLIDRQHSGQRSACVQEYVGQDGAHSLSLCAGRTGGTVPGHRLPPRQPHRAGAESEP